MSKCCVQPSRDLWQHLHVLLHGKDKLRFPLPLNPCSDQTFSSLFGPEQPSAHLILDDAHALCAMPEEAIASFLATVRMLRDERSDPCNRGSLASMTLLGVEGLTSKFLNRPGSPQIQIFNSQW